MLKTNGTELNRPLEEYLFFLEFILRILPLVHLLWVTLGSFFVKQFAVMPKKIIDDWNLDYL